MALLPSVHLDDVLRIDREVLVRIYHYAEQPGIGLRKNTHKEVSQ